jgi:fluoroquinolone transport system permease protein
MSGFAALLRKDVLGIYRDGFLVAMTVYSLVITGVSRIVVRWIPVEHIELYVAPFIILTATALIGLVFGFGLIEEREARTSLLMRVLPVSPGLLAMYWTVVVGGFCLAISLGSALIFGVRPARPGLFLMLCSASALGAPVVMLLLGALASNKIEGLAVGKVISGSSLLLAAVFVLPPNWHVSLSWYPWYWIYLGLLDAYAGVDRAGLLAVTPLRLPLWAYVVVPTVLNAAAIVLLVRRYRRVV